MRICTYWSCYAGTRHRPPAYARSHSLISIRFDLFENIERCFQLSIMTFTQKHWVRDKLWPQLLHQFYRTAGNIRFVSSKICTGLRFVEQYCLPVPGPVGYFMFGRVTGDRITGCPLHCQSPRLNLNEPVAWAACLSRKGTGRLWQLVVGFKLLGKLISPTTHIQLEYQSNQSPILNDVACMIY